MSGMICKLWTRALRHRKSRWHTFQNETETPFDLGSKKHRKIQAKFFKNRIKTSWNSVQNACRHDIAPRVWYFDVPEGPQALQERPRGSPMVSQGPLRAPQGAGLKLTKPPQRLSQTPPRPPKTPQSLPRASKSVPKASRRPSKGFSKPLRRHSNGFSKAVPRLPEGIPWLVYSLVLSSLALSSLV